MKTNKSHQTKNDHIITDDLAFSAYLKMKGYRFIKSDRKRSKAFFTFEVSEDIEQLKVEFINSEFVNFYNEIRNLKKIISTK